MSLIINPYRFVTAGGGGAATVTAKQFRVRPTVQGGAEAFWSLSEIAFLTEAGSFPSGYTIIGSGVTTLANLFNSTNDRNYMSTNGSAWAGVKYTSAQDIRTIRITAPTSWPQQWARQFVLETRAEDADPWDLVTTFYQGRVQPAALEIRDFIAAGYENEVGGYSQYKFEIVSNYGQAGADTYFTELELLNDAASANRDMITFSGDNTSYGLLDGTKGDQANLVSGPLPAEIIITFPYQKLLDQMKVSFRGPAYQKQGPNRMILYGSNDGGTTYDTVKDTGTNGTDPTSQETRDYTW